MNQTCSQLLPTLLADWSIQMLDEADPPGDGDRTRGLIDPDRLGQWMDAEGLPGSGNEIQATFVTGGASNELFDIQRGEHRWALRRPPRMVPEGRNETMLREYRILTALADTDVPHPTARAVCTDHSVLGSTFYLMDFIDGWSPISEPDWPELEEFKPCMVAILIDRARYKGWLRALPARRPRRRRGTIDKSAIYPHTSK